MGIVVSVLYQISYAFQQCKNFENRLRIDKVTESLKVGIFCETMYKHLFAKRRACLSAVVIPAVCLSVRWWTRLHVQLTRRSVYWS